MFDRHDDKIVLLDMNVQRDIFHPSGSIYDPDAGRAYRNIIKLYEWARRSSVPVISTVLLNRIGRRGALSVVPHCIEGTRGELKMPGTYMPGSVNLGNSHTADLPDGILDDTSQIIFETRDTDPFHHQKFDRLVSEMPLGYRFVICGAALSCGIKQAVLGLVAHQQQVTIVCDAVVSLAMAQTEMDWLKLAAKGAEILRVSTLMGGLSVRQGSCHQAAAS